MSAPNSFLFFGREGRKFRVYFNPQRKKWYASFKAGVSRERVSLGVSTKALAENAVKRLDVPAAVPTPAAPPVAAKLK